MCRSDGLIGLSNTRRSASPGAKGGVGISVSFNTLFGSPVSRKINAFITTSWVFRRRLIPADILLRLPNTSVQCERYGSRVAALKVRDRRVPHAASGDAEEYPSEK